MLVPSQVASGGEGDLNSRASPCRWRYSSIRAIAASVAKGDEHLCVCSPRYLPDFCVFACFSVIFVWPALPSACLTFLCVLVCLSSVYLLVYLPSVCVYLTSYLPVRLSFCLPRVFCWSACQHDICVFDVCLSSFLCVCQPA